MKIDRLLGIITILTQKEKVTAPFLAERFEVSRRTINRDIEDICMAGIPIVTKQGAGGGIYIQEGYKLDKKLLSSHELADIITALKGLKSVSKTRDIEMLLSKLLPCEKAEITLNDSIIIDLASYHKNSLSDKIEQIKKAINNSNTIKFTYYGKKGEHERQIEPNIITFKWSDWYVFGYCLDKNDFRMFKLNRLWDLLITDKKFFKRTLPPESQDFDAHLTDENEFEAVFNRSVKYLLVESYGPNCYEELADGKLLFEGNYTNRDYIISWILGFGDKAEVTAPCDLADEILTIAKKITKKYEHDI